MPTDTKLNSLIINYLTEAQYKGTTPNENELYLTPDGGSEIETIDGTWTIGSEDFTLSKTPTSFPFIAKFIDSTNNATMEVYFCNGFVANGEQEYIGFWNDAQRMFAFFYSPSYSSLNSVKSHPFMTEPWKDGCVLASETSEENKCEWQSLKTVGGQSLLGTGDIPVGGMETINGTSDDDGNVTLAKKPTGDAFLLVVNNAQAMVMTRFNENSLAYQGSYSINTQGTLNIVILSFADVSQSLKATPKIFEYNPAILDGVAEVLENVQAKTYLHSLTAKGATLSMSFTYPSTNQLPVDSPQDATTVIKPTTNEYFASPVVVIATKKISDSYNCIYYNGTLWKFALWDGTSFTDGEAVTTWADSVVSVD